MSAEQEAFDEYFEKNSGFRKPPSEPTIGTLRDRMVRLCEELRGVKAQIKSHEQYADARRAACKGWAARSLYRPVQDMDAMQAWAAKKEERIMRKFRKKPVIIEAIQLRSDAQALEELCEFMNITGMGSFEYCGRGIDPRDGRFKISTLEGVMIANVGDWIIRGVSGEFYPCKPDIFAATYEPVED